MTGSQRSRDGPKTPREHRAKSPIAWGYAEGRQGVAASQYRPSKHNSELALADQLTHLVVRSPMTLPGSLVTLTSGTGHVGAVEQVRPFHGFRALAGVAGGKQ